MKTRKKYRSVAFFLVLTLLFSLSTPVVAADVHTDLIKGIILYSNEEIATTRASLQTVIISYEDHADGSTSIYQYENGILVEEDRTVPGSGVVYHTYYELDGTVTCETEITKPVAGESNIMPLVNRDPYSDLSSSASTRPLGYMHYRLPSSGATYSINCYVIDEQHLNQSYTFNAGAVERLSSAISKLLSVFAFSCGKEGLALAIFEFLELSNILEGVSKGVLTYLMTETIRCDYNNQEIHGDSTSHSGRPHGRLDGTYAVVKTSAGETEVVTEGYTVRDWGNPGMGRMMMYQVFGIEAAPTSWTNLNG